MNWKVVDKMSKHELRDEVNHLRKRVTSLEGGECRFHCCVRADMWKTGFVWGVKHVNLEHGITKPGHLKDADEAYYTWRHQHDGDK